MDWRTRRWGEGLQAFWREIAAALPRVVETWVPAFVGLPQELLAGCAVLAVLLALLVVVRSSRTRDLDGSPEAVEREVQRLIERNEYSKAGDLRAKQGDFERALALYSHSGNLHKAALCHLSLKHPGRAARIYVEMGRLAEAAHHFQTAGEWREAAECLDELGSQREAAELYERSGNLACAARLLRSLGDAESAARLFERAEMGAEAAAALLEARGREPEILRRCGQLYRGAGESNRAAECFAAAGEWTEAADIFEERGEYTLAGQAFERAQLWDRAAAAYERAGSLPEARVNYERAGDHVRVAQIAQELGDLLEAGRGFYELGAVERAIEVLQRVPPDSPGSQSASLILGRIFVEKRLYARARERLERVASPSPRTKDDLEALMLLAEAYEGLGQALQAVQLLEQVTQVDPDYADAAERMDRLQEHAWSESNPPPGYYDSRYELRGEIGRGGMGVVYLAQDGELGREVALKFLPAELAINTSAVTMFRAEARAAAAMNHPNIVMVYDVGVLGGRPCIIMEYVPGKTARELLREAKTEKRTALAARTVAQIGRDIARALSYAHSQGVIHRDVKPSNILISPRAGTKLMDFGISKVLESQSDGNTDARGTPQYMPPEQILGREIDGRTDLYALGISMFELLVGRRPFVGDKILDQQLHSPVPDPRTIDSRVPETLARIVMRLCEKNRDDRYESADELGAALDLFLRPS
jgi:tetratricopeptide (TPR) repeat protein